MRRHGLSAAAIALATGWLAAAPAGAVDYEQIKQLGITELRMTEAGGPSGEFDPGGLPRALPEGERHHGDPREPERARQAPRDGRGGRGDLDPARAREHRARAGQGSRSGRAARLGRDRPHADLRRGQGRVRLRLSVLLDDLRLARGRQGAGELGGPVRHRGLPRHARVPRLPELHPADGAARRRRRARRPLPARPRPRLRQARGDQGQRRGLVAGGRAAAAAAARTTRCSTRSPGRAGSPARRASTTASTRASSTSPTSSCPRAPMPTRRRRRRASSTR